MYVVQVQKDLVDLSKHYIHEIDALVSLDRAECFVLEKKNMQKQLHSSSKIISLQSQHFHGIQIVKNKFCLIYACTADLMHVLWTCLFARAAGLMHALQTCLFAHTVGLFVCTRCGPV